MTLGAYILSSPSLLGGANVLGAGINLPVLTYIRNGEAPLIRWGTSLNPFTTDTEYNHPEVIRTCGNKRKLDLVLRTAKIAHLEYFSESEVPDHYPVCVRTVMNGHGGEGIVIAQSAEEWANLMQYPWSYWQNFEFELGVHVLGGMVCRIFKKIAPELGAVASEQFPIRNMERGYHFSLRDNSHYPKLQAFISKVCEIVPLKFGRFDIGLEKESRQFYVIEINTAPGLTENQNTADLYISYLRDVL